jgi:hypothetical protein
MTDPGISDHPDAEGSFAAGDTDPNASFDREGGGEEPAPIREWVDAVQGVIVHNATTRPYTTLLVAGAVGYVLAAGIPSVVSKAALNAGGRMVMARLVQTLLSDQL